MIKKVRIDKWLWSVRIFKTRSIAKTACDAGKVKIGETKAKPSATVKGGETIYVSKGGYNLVFKVVELIEKRVGAPKAQLCYENLTPPEEMKKFSDWFIGKGLNEMRDRGTGRPTKRERREIDEYKDVETENDFGWDEFDDEEV